MKDFHPLVAIIICIIVGLILYTVTDNIRNKDKYAACQRDFKNNPYSFRISQDYTTRVKI